MRPRARPRPRPPALVVPALLAVLALLLLPGACDRSSIPTAQAPAGAQVSAPASYPVQPPAAPSAGTQTPAQAAPSAVAQAAPSAAADTAPVLLMLGDSLTAGYGLAPEAAFPALIQERLRAAGSPYRVVNAGVSGDTSAGGLARLDWLLKQRVDVLLLELGANDGLRGQDPQAMRANLATIIERCQGRGITVVLAGMQMPANYGADYRRAFGAVFPELATKYKLALVPFLLEGVAMRPELNQADGIHPNEEGERIVADTLWKTLKPVLDKP